MRVAIVGSRDFDVYDENLEDAAPNSHTYGLSHMIERLVLSMENEDHVVSGGATGADSIAEDFAKRYHIGRSIHEPAWKKYGKSAGHRRNSLIVKEADILFAFHTDWTKSIGTTNCVNQARKKGIPVYEFDALTSLWYIDGEPAYVVIEAMYGQILTQRRRVIESSAQRDEGERCDPVAGTHSSPHKGCILR